MKEFRKILEADLQWLSSGRLKRLTHHLQFSKHSRIDIAQFPARRQLRNQMRVLLDLLIGVRNNHFARHPQVHDPLRMLRRSFASVAFEIDGNMFSDATYLRQPRSLERGSDFSRRRQQRLLALADPHGFDHVARNSLRQSTRNRLYLRKFRHELSLQRSLGRNLAPISAFFGRGGKANQKNSSALLTPSIALRTPAM